MSAKQQGVLCDICHQRHATVQVRVRENGRQTTLNVFRQDYARLQAEHRQSPFESLFGGSPLGSFGDDFFDRFFESSASRPSRREREVVDIDEYLSEQAKDLLKEAARLAVESGARHIDSEHLLSALADSEVVHDVLRGSLEELPVGLGSVEACLADGSGDATLPEASVPDVGTGFYYLVRGTSACGVGSYGFATSGGERTSGACPRAGRPS